jgi:outer membrane lipoprotein-sorting protein
MNRFCIKRYFRKTGLLMIVGGLMFVSSCKPTRVLTPVVTDRAVDQVLSSMQAAQASFDFFSARFTGSVNYGGTQTDIGGTIRVRKDSAIFVSVAPFLGIEVARILITPDHVKILNRLEGTYFEGDMQKINGMLNADLDFYMLQSMLVGNDLTHFSTRNFRLSGEKDVLLLHNPERIRINSQIHNAGRFEQNMWLDNQTFRITQTTLFEKNSNRNIQAKYPGFTTVQGQSFPSEIFLLFSDMSSSAQLTARYSRITIDQPQDITFSIPSRYTPMDF